MFSKLVGWAVSLAVIAVLIVIATRSADIVEMARYQQQLASDPYAQLMDIRESSGGNWLWIVIVVAVGGVVAAVLLSLGRALREYRLFAKGRVAKPKTVPRSAQRPPLSVAPPPPHAPPPPRFRIRDEFPDVQ